MITKPTALRSYTIGGPEAARMRKSLNNSYAFSIIIETFQQLFLLI